MTSCSQFSMLALVAAAVTVLALMAGPRGADAAVANAQLKVGQRFDFNVPGGLVVKRTAFGSDAEPQYLFAGGPAGWTSDGKKRVGDGILHWNGTMVLPSVTKDDEGSYSFPAERTDPHLAGTLLQIYVQ